ncbi:tripartite tricarboxylate transporter substrate binding protein [Pigmentiphaga soli]|uniref:Tripartite tricarboxylate transporter substrate binding protein n=1 Tax=Pigmentiphaga soli TaxID=1007095 RepID=A0ABP8GM61_9BURK
MKRLLWCGAALWAAALSLSPAALRAQEWPAKPIRLIVAFPVGSATDSIARVVGKEISAALGQSVVIDNRPGAGGAIAAEAVARSAPDGYTLLMGTNTQFAANVSLYKKLSYDPVKDFSPVVLLTTQPTVLLVRQDFPARTLADFVSHAKAAPKKLSAGYGSASTQVAIAKLRTLAGLDLIEVPYKGVPQAVIDVVGGTLDFTFADLGSGLQQAAGGKVRALAVTSGQRSPLAPDWPAAAETYPGIDIFGWHAIVAPAGTPPDVVRKFYEASIKALKRQEVAENLAGLGVTPAPMGPEELGRFIKEDIVRWAGLIKEAGIQPE